MKIAYVIPDLKVKGGIQQFAYSISKSVNKDIIIDTFDYEYASFIKIGNILHKLPNKVGALLFQHIFSYHFKKKLNLDNYDLIHFWHIDAATAYTDRNYIVTCHGLEILKDNVQNYKIELYNKVLKNALQVTADSVYTKELLLQNFDVNENKIIVINPPVDTKKFKKKHIKSSKFVIGSLSRFVERKNFINIIKALEYLHQTLKVDFIYHIAGTGPDKSKILNKLKKVSFEWKYFGEISEEAKINKFYPSLDIFLLPTLSLNNSIEGFGIVYIEANSAGIPVIASPVGGVKDAIQDDYSGLFCDPTDYKDIANKINLISKKRTLFKKNLEVWVKAFDISKISRRFNTIYNINKK